ncbi:hypothetical protein DIPPA_51239 [Diplonema papillatum]|nr:hypothetical protein DIPPA_51239 [Diplonema papillatum]
MTRKKNRKSVTRFNGVGNFADPAVSSDGGPCDQFTPPSLAGACALHPGDVSCTHDSATNEPLTLSLTRSADATDGLPISSSTPGPHYVDTAPLPADPKYTPCTGLSNHEGKILFKARHDPESASAPSSFDAASRYPRVNLRRGCDSSEPNIRHATNQGRLLPAHPNSNDMHKQLHTAPNFVPNQSNKAAQQQKTATPQVCVASKCDEPSAVPSHASSGGGQQAGRAENDEGCASHRQSCLLAASSSGAPTDDATSNQSAQKTRWAKKLCKHNDWDNVRLSKGVLMLRCRVCQKQCRGRVEVVWGSRKCKEFNTEEGCPNGTDCPLLHIHHRKLSLEQRMQTHGDLLLAKVGSEKIQELLQKAQEQKMQQRRQRVLQMNNEGTSNDAKDESPETAPMDAANELSCSSAAEAANHENARGIDVAPSALVPNQSRPAWHTALKNSLNNKVDDAAESDTTDSDAGEENDTSPEEARYRALRSDDPPHRGPTPTSAKSAQPAAVVCCHSTREGALQHVARNTRLGGSQSQMLAVNVPNSSASIPSKATSVRDECKRFPSQSIADHAVDHVDTAHVHGADYPPGSRLLKYQIIDADAKGSKHVRDSRASPTRPGFFNLSLAGPRPLSSALPAYPYSTGPRTTKTAAVTRDLGFDSQTCSSIGYNTSSHGSGSGTGTSGGAKRHNSVPIISSNSGSDDGPKSNSQGVTDGNVRSCNSGSDDGPKSTSRDNVDNNLRDINSGSDDGPKSNSQGMTDSNLRDSNSGSDDGPKSNSQEANRDSNSSSEDGTACATTSRCPPNNLHQPVTEGSKSEPLASNINEDMHHSSTTRCSALSTNNYSHSLRQSETRGADNRSDRTRSVDGAASRNLPPLCTRNCSATSVDERGRDLNSGLYNPERVERLNTPKHVLDTPQVSASASIRDSNSGSDSDGTRSSSNPPPLDSGSDGSQHVGSDRCPATAKKYASPSYDHRCKQDRQHADLHIAGNSLSMPLSHEAPSSKTTFPNCDRGLQPTRNLEHAAVSHVSPTTFDRHVNSVQLGPSEGRHISEVVGTSSTHKPPISGTTNKKAGSNGESSGSDGRVASSHSYSHSPPVSRNSKLKGSNLSENQNRMAPSDYVAVSLVNIHYNDAHAALQAGMPDLCKREENRAPSSTSPQPPVDDSTNSQGFSTSDVGFATHHSLPTSSMSNKQSQKDESGVGRGRNSNPNEAEGDHRLRRASRDDISNADGDMSTVRAQAPPSSSSQPADEGTLNNRDIGTYSDGVFSSHSPPSSICSRRRSEPSSGANSGDEGAEHDRLSNSGSGESNESTGDDEEVRCAALMLGRSQAVDGQDQADLERPALLRRPENVSSAQPASRPSHSSADGEHRSHLQLFSRSSHTGPSISPGCAVPTVCQLTGPNLAKKVSHVSYAQDDRGSNLQARPVPIPSSFLVDAKVRPVPTPTTTLVDARGGPVPIHSTSLVGAKPAGNNWPSRDSGMHVRPVQQHPRGELEVERLLAQHSAARWISSPPDFLEHQAKSVQHGSTQLPQQQEQLRYNTVNQSPQHQPQHENPAENNRCFPPSHSSAQVSNTGWYAPPKCITHPVPTDIPSTHMSICSTGSNSSIQDHQHGLEQCHTCHRTASKTSMGQIVMNSPHCTMYGYIAGASPSVTPAPQAVGVIVPHTMQTYGFSPVSQGSAQGITSTAQTHNFYSISAPVTRIVFQGWQPPR